MKAMQAQLKTLTSVQKNKQVQRRNTTAGAAEATTLTGEKPYHQRKRDTKMTHTTRKEWAILKRSVCDS